MTKLDEKIKVKEIFIIFLSAITVHQLLRRFLLNLKKSKKSIAPLLGGSH